MIEDLNKDILNIRDVRKNLPQIVDEVANERTNKVIIRHGKPAAVLVNVEEYQEMRDRLLAMELEAELYQALEEDKRGELVSLNELIDEMIEESGLDLDKSAAKSKGSKKLAPKSKVESDVRAS